MSKLYSVILLSYYSEKRIINVFTRVCKALEKENIPFEFIIMDDGSKDKSFEVAQELEKKRNRGKKLEKKKNRGKTKPARF